MLYLVQYLFDDGGPHQLPDVRLQFAVERVAADARVRRVTIHVSAASLRQRRVTNDRRQHSPSATQPAGLTGHVQRSGRGGGG